MCIKDLHLINLYLLFNYIHHLLVFHYVLQLYILIIFYGVQHIQLFNPYHLLKIP